MITSIRLTVAAMLFSMVAVRAPAMEAARSEALPAASFSEAPRAELKGGNVTVTFAVSQPSDVAVRVYDAEGKVVRHLAAGLLGANAPAPFQKDSLKQSLVWEGKDDIGKAVPPGAYTVRVGMRTRAHFDKAIGHSSAWLGAIHAMAVGPKGDLYVYNGRGISVLNRNGEYLRQIVPAPHELPAEQLAGLAPVRLADGSMLRSRSYDLPAKMKAVGSMTISSRGEILIPGAEGYARNLTRIGLDGSVGTNAFTTPLTKLADVGYLYVAVSPDGRTAYAAGAEAGYRGDDARSVCYRQAVYRVDLDRGGPAEIFTGDDENSGGPGFSVNHPKGVATDSDGRVYVCNYGGNNIAVYTPRAGLIRSVKVDAPQQLAVQPRTGRLYVLAGKEEGYSKYGYDNPATMKEARLLRISAEGQVEAETKLEDPASRGGKTRPGPSYMLSMAADFTGERPVLWVGVSSPGGTGSKWRLLRIEDEGATFGKPRETVSAPGFEILTMAPLQLRLDRRRDELYYNSWSTKLMRMSSDGKSLPWVKLLPVDSDERYYISEAAIGADDHIYALTWVGEYGYKDIRVRRFGMDGRQKPFEGGKLDTGTIPGRPMKGASGGSARGFDVDARGNTYVAYYDARRPEESVALWDRGWTYNVAVAVYGPDGNLADERRIAHLRAGTHGLRVDGEGNVFVGDSLMPPGVTYPYDLAAALPDPLARPNPAMLPDASFDPLLRWMGSVFKFGPRGGSITGLPDDDGVLEKHVRRPADDVWRPVPEVEWFLRNNHRVRIQGALWQYHGFSPLPAEYQGVTHVERCVCSGGRFDVDEFGRVVVPDRIRHRVTVLDAAGNVLLRFGQYGNQDAVSRDSDIRMADPTWIAAASDRVYVGEGSPSRVLRIRLEPSMEAKAEVTIGR